MTEATSSPIQELCVVGAGITGMNALVVASTHLPHGAPVTVVDSRPQVGGMWVDTYDHVRLHQPHGIFTAGNIGWDLDVAPSHLATKPEVLGQFARCWAIARERLGVDARLGWHYTAHTETDDLVEVTLTGPEGQAEVIRTRRLIKALGHAVQPNPPLAVSTDRVRSVSPEQLVGHRDALRADDSPVWIIGSGKTAMDAVQWLLAEVPGREVNMLAGPGTLFARRDAFFPVGARRWWAGTPINTMLRQVARRFDGTNEDEVRAWFRDSYGISPTAEARDFFSAYLSEAECAQITAGLRRVKNSYFADAVDRGDAVDLVLRDGGRIAAPAGTWVVNCTGSLLRTPHAYEPYVSSSGRTVSLQMRSSTTGVFSAFAGYYLTHLMFRDRLVDLGLYELDVEDLAAKAKPTLIFASMTQSMHNLSLISDALPNKAFLDCGLDYDRWYPLPRRMLGTAEFLRTHRGDRAHQRAALDTLHRRYDVRCGPLGV